MVFAHESGIDTKTTSQSAPVSDMLLFPTSVTVQAPNSGYTAPVGFGLIFLLDQKEEADQLTAAYDDFTREQAADLFARRAARGGRVGPGEPVAAFDIKPNNDDPFTEWITYVVHCNTITKPRLSFSACTQAHENAARREWLDAG